MNAHASPPAALSESTLGAVLATLSPHDEKALVIVYGGQTIQPGYHVTEVKAGSFVTLDCGGNPDAWQETILQVEDLPAADGQDFMKVGKFRSILAQVDRKLRLDHNARLTVEVGPPRVPMQVFDIAGIDIEGDRILLRLGARPAICKPRHRAEANPAVACCSPGSTNSNCCA